MLFWDSLIIEMGHKQVRPKELFIGHKQVVLTQCKADSYPVPGNSLFCRVSDLVHNCIGAWDRAVAAYSNAVHIPGRLASNTQSNQQAERAFNNNGTVEIPFPPTVTNTGGGHL